MIGEEKHFKINHEWTVVVFCADLSGTKFNFDCKFFKGTEFVGVQAPIRSAACEVEPDFEGAAKAAISFALGDIEHARRTHSDDPFYENDFEQAVQMDENLTTYVITEVEFNEAQP